MTNFADPKVGCAAGELCLRAAGHDAATSAIGGLYWRYEQWIRKSEAAFGSPVGVYGGFYAVRRELVAQQPTGMILDDLYQPLAVIRKGYRSVLDQKALVYDTWPKDVTGEFHRKVRTLAGNYQLVQLVPWSVTLSNPILFQFLSHKVLRLFVPYLLVLIQVSCATLAIGSWPYAALTILQFASWLAALISLRFEIPLLQRALAPVSALLVLNAAAVVGLFRFFTTRGPLWKIWTSRQLVHGR